MKIRNLFGTMIIVVAFVAPSARAQDEKKLNALLTTLKANVAKVSEAGEKERWQANIDLWQIHLGRSGMICETDLRKMSALLDRIKANIAKVGDAGEKERWQADIGLWQTIIDSKGEIDKSATEKLKTPFEKMRGNVTKITEAGEKERWQANRDLWQLVIGRVTAPSDYDKTSGPKDAYLGIGVDSVPAVLYSQMPTVLPKDQGVLVTQVAKNSSAEKAGLHPQDILLTYGDQKLTSPEQLMKLVRSDKPDHQVVLEFLRGGKTMACKVTLGEATVVESRKIPDSSHIFRFLPDERFRKLFEEMESKLDEASWDHFDSLKLSRLDGKHWKAEIEHRTSNGQKVAKEYAGTRNEIRKAIEADKDLPADERDRLLRSLNLRDPIFEFHFPPFGPMGSAPKNRP